MARQPHLFCAYFELPQHQTRVDSISKECATVYVPYGVCRFDRVLFFLLASHCTLDFVYFPRRECTRALAFLLILFRRNLIWTESYVYCMPTWMYIQCSKCSLSLSTNRRERFEFVLAAYSIIRALYAAGTMLLLLLLFLCVFFACRFILFDWIVLQYFCMFASLFSFISNALNSNLLKCLS